MRATTNQIYCPTLVDKVKDTKVKDFGGVTEIVIDGISEEKVREAMAEGIKSIQNLSGIKRISAGNYGGTLGKVSIHLHDLI
jgi:formylmethanofuran--tetrahydromethanopterin N-formyltransferase